MAAQLLAEFVALSPRSQGEFMRRLVDYVAARENPSEEEGVLDPRALAAELEAVLLLRDEVEGAVHAREPLDEEEKEEEADVENVSANLDPLRFSLCGSDPFALGRRRGQCLYSYIAGGRELSGSQGAERQGVLLALASECREEYGGVGVGKHLDALAEKVLVVVQHPGVSRFMVGKCSFDRDDNLHSGMQKRHVNKYKEAGYTKLVGLALQDGAECERAQENMLAIEGELLLRLRAHPKLDVRLSCSANGARVAKPLVKDKLFVVYLALCPRDAN